MVKRAIIIQARMSSSRIPGKSLKLIGGKPLIHYVIARLQILRLPIIVATSTDSSDDILVNYLKEQNDISIYRGDLNNVLQRYINAASKYNITEIIRITADNPFVDIDALKLYISQFSEYNYLDGIYPGGWIKGTGFEFVLLEELKKIEHTSLDHLEHVTLALREQINKNPKFLKLETPLHQKKELSLRLTCDYYEDFKLIAAILKNFDFSTNVNVKDIIALSKTKPEMFKSNMKFK